MPCSLLLYLTHHNVNALCSIFTWYKTNKSEVAWEVFFFLTHFITYPHTLIFPESMPFQPAIFNEHTVHVFNVSSHYRQKSNLNGFICQECKIVITVCVLRFQGGTLIYSHTLSTSTIGQTSFHTKQIEHKQGNWVENNTKSILKISRVMSASSNLR